MALRLVTPPAALPVTVAEARTQLRVIHESDDTQIEAYIAAAVDHLDGTKGQLGRALTEQTWELLLDAFPAGPIEIPLPPLQTIDSVQYYDTDGVLQTVSTDDYTVDTASEPGWIAPVDCWPSTMDTINAVVIRFTAGYATLPPALRAAILLMVRDLYEEKPGASDAAVDRLTFAYRVFSL